MADFEVTGEASIDSDTMVEDIDAILDKLDELAEKIDDIDAKIDELSEKGIKIEVEILGQDKLDELKLFLDDIADHEYIVNLRIEIDGEDKVDELKLKLDELDDEPHEIDVRINDADMADAEAKLSALNSQLDNNSKKLDASKKSSDGFQFSMMMLAPALIPVSAALLSVVGGAGGLASAFATMVPPLALAAYGTDQLYKSVTTLYSGLSASTQAALNNAKTYGQMYQILAKNSTAFRDANSYIEEAIVRYTILKQVVSQFESAIEDQGLVILINGFSLLTEALSMLIDPAVQAAKAVQLLLQDFATRLQDPTFQTFFDNMDKNIESLVLDWGGGVENIVEGVVALLNAFMPLSMDVSGGFLHMTQSFDTWAQKIGNTAGWKTFVGTVETDGPKILGVLGDIVRIIAHLVAAMGEQSFNTKIFDDLFNGLSKLSNLTGAHQGLTAITADIGLLGIAAIKLGPALGPLLSFIATPEGAAIALILGLAAAFIAAYHSSSQFGNWVRTNLVPLLKQLEGDVKQVEQWFISIWPSIEKVWQMYGKNIENIVVADLKFLVDTIGNAMKVIEGVIDVILGLLTGNWSLVWKGIKSIFGSVWNEIIDAAKNFNTTMKNEFEAGWKLVSADASGAWDEINQNFDRNMGDIESTAKGGFDTVTRDATQWGKDFANAVVNGINAALSYFGMLDIRILGALGNTGTLLWNAGVNIIDGLINGIESMIGDVESTLSNLTSWISSWKGPPEKDKTLLNPAGASIIQGLIDGMESKYGGVENSLGGLTKTIGSKFGQQFTTDINAQVNASLNAVGNNSGLAANAAGGAGSGGVNVNSGAIQINNPTAEPASVSLTKLLQNGAKFGMLQAPIGTPSGA